MEEYDFQLRQNRVLRPQNSQTRDLREPTKQTNYIMVIRIRKSLASILLVFPLMRCYQSAITSKWATNPGPPAGRVKEAMMISNTAKVVAALYKTSQMLWTYDDDDSGNKSANPLQQDYTVGEMNFINFFGSTNALSYTDYTNNPANYFLISVNPGPTHLKSFLYGQRMLFGCWVKGASLVVIGSASGRVQIIDSSMLDGASNSKVSSIKDTNRNGERPEEFEGTTHIFIGTLQTKVIIIDRTSYSTLFSTTILQSGSVLVVSAKKDTQLFLVGVTSGTICSALLDKSQSSFPLIRNFICSHLGTQLKYFSGTNFFFQHAGFDSTTYPIGIYNDQSPIHVDESLTFTFKGFSVVSVFGKRNVFVSTGEDSPQINFIQHTVPVFICFNGCAACTANNDANSCTSCMPGYVLSGNQCQVICQNNQYVISQTNTCGQCHSSCTRCSGPSLTECVACKNEVEYLKFDNSCQQCHASCINCNGGTINSCLGCHTDYVLQGDNSCLKNCALDSQFQTSDYQPCGVCAPICRTCSGELYTNCLTCQDGYYLSEAKECMLCDLACVTCSGPGQDKCSSCKTPEYLNFTLPTTPPGYECRKPCATGQFYDNAQSTCLPCNEACSSCFERTHKTCQPNSCNEPAFLPYSQDNNYCLRVCPDGQYLEISDNSCWACPSSCKTCTGPLSTMCTSCSPLLSQTQYVQINGQCARGCNENQVYVKNSTHCGNCDSECKTCDGPSSNNCLTCQDPAKFILVTSCVLRCPEFYFESQEQMKCGECSDKATCLRCKDGSQNGCIKCKSDNLVLYKGKCYDCTTTDEQIRQEGCQGMIYVQLQLQKVPKQNKESTNFLVIEASLNFEGYDTVLEGLKSQYPLQNLSNDQKKDGRFYADISSFLGLKGYLGTDTTKKSVISSWDVKFLGFQIYFSILYDPKLAPRELKDNDEIFIEVTSKQQVIYSDFKIVDSKQVKTIPLVLFNKPEQTFILKETYFGQASQQQVQAAAANAEQTSQATQGATVAATGIVMTASSAGADVFEPLMAFFIILKMINRLKLINIFYGEILETFLGQIGDVFKIGGSLKSDMDFIYDYKFRYKLNKYGIQVLSIMPVVDKQIFFVLVLGLKFGVKKMLKYVVSFNKLQLWDQRLTSIVLPLQVICLTMTIYDITLYSSRTLMHMNRFNDDIQTNWGDINFLASFLIFQLIVIDLMNLFYINNIFHLMTKQIERNIITFKYLKLLKKTIKGEMRKKTEVLAKKIAEEVAIKQELNEEELWIYYAKKEDPLKVQVTKRLLTQDKINPSTYYFNFFCKDLKISHMLTKRICKFYSFIFIIRLVMFEPMYISMQPLKHPQALLIIFVQFLMTIYSVKVTLWDRSFQSILMGLVKLFFDIAITSFLIVGFSIDYLGRKGFPDKATWINVQYIGLAVITTCCGVIFLNLFYSMIIGVRQAIRNCKEKRRLKAEQAELERAKKRAGEERLKQIYEELAEKERLKKEGQKQAREDQIDNIDKDLLGDDYLYKKYAEKQVKIRAHQDQFDRGMFQKEHLGNQKLTKMEKRVKDLVDSQQQNQNSSRQTDLASEQKINSFLEKLGIPAKKVKRHPRSYQSEEQMPLNQSEDLQIQENKIDLQSAALQFNSKGLIISGLQLPVQDLQDPSQKSLDRQQLSLNIEQASENDIQQVIKRVNKRKQQQQSLNKENNVNRQQEDQDSNQVLKKKVSSKRDEEEMLQEKPENEWQQLSPPPKKLKQPKKNKINLQQVQNKVEQKVVKKKKNIKKPKLLQMIDNNLIIEDQKEEVLMPQNDHKISGSNQIKAEAQRKDKRNFQQPASVQPVPETSFLQDKNVENSKDDVDMISNNEGNKRKKQVRKPKEKKVKLINEQEEKPIKKIKQVKVTQKPISDVEMAFKGLFASRKKGK